MNSHKILVTGSEGFIGRHLCLKLRDEMPDFEVIHFDHSNGNEILDAEQLADIGPVDTVVHLAASVCILNSMDDPYTYYYNNIVGTLNLLEYCRKTCTRRFIYSSSYLYGAPEYLPIDEGHMLGINNPYGRSKKIGEELGSYYADFGMEFISLRNFNIYGEGQAEYFLIPSILRQLKESSVVTISDIRPKRDFVYVGDVTDAFLKAIQVDMKSRIEIVNIGSGISYSVDEVIDLIAKFSGRNIEIIDRQLHRPNEIMNTVADIEKARKILHWQPRTKLQEGLEKLYKAACI